ncbi:MAG TPA: hypothetical protein VGG28_33835 [Kofleriaceae bacterium]|jgi:hypothetical protein
MAQVAPSMARDHAFVNVALTGLSCAAGAPDLAATSDVALLEKLCREALAGTVAGEDDRYQIYGALFALHTQTNDAAGAKAIADAYLDYVKHRPAPQNDDERMARDLALVRAATDDGTPELAIAQLEASERALANDPDASLRLAKLYVASNRSADAIAATTRGLARSPTPTQTARLYGVRATVLAKQHALDDAKRDLDAGLAAAQRINGAQSRAGTIASLQQQRAALSP